MAVIAAVAVTACGASGPPVGSPPDLTQPSDSAPLEDTVSAQDPLTPDDVFPAEAVVREHERFGLLTQSREPDQTLRLSDGEPVQLTTEIVEDRVSRSVLALSTAAPGLPGRFIVLVAPDGPDPVTVHEVSWNTEQSATALTLVTNAGAALTGRWSYSRQPRFRTAIISDIDDAFTAEITVLHTADYGPGPVEPMIAQANGDRATATFVLPPWLTGQAVAADQCEEVVHQLSQLVGNRAGTDSTGTDSTGTDSAGTDPGAEAALWFGPSVTEPAALSAAVEVIEEQLDLAGRLHIVVETMGNEVIHGKRLQPLVRYPVTVIDRSGMKTAATLGCSIS